MNQLNSRTTLSLTEQAITERVFRRQLREITGRYHLQIRAKETPYILSLFVGDYDIHSDICQHSDCPLRTANCSLLTGKTQKILIIQQHVRTNVTIKHETTQTVRRLQTVCSPRNCMS